jgi:hypothetical protein
MTTASIISGSAEAKALGKKLETPPKMITSPLG